MLTYFPAWSGDLCYRSWDNSIGTVDVIYPNKTEALHYLAGKVSDPHSRARALRRVDRPRLSRSASELTSPHPLTLPSLPNFG